MLGISAPHVLAFLAVAVLVIVIPGPSVLFIVSRALANGRRIAVLSVFGNAAGEYLQVVLVAVGIGAFAERSVALFTLLKTLGGLYLLYLGLRSFRERGKLVGALEAVSTTASDRRSFGQGFVVGASNPKTIVFLAAILPQFVTLAAGRVPLQILMLGAMFSTIALLSDSLWALAAGTLRVWLHRSPRRLALVGGAGGLAIMGVGAALLVSGRKT